MPHFESELIALTRDKQYKINKLTRRYLPKYPGFEYIGLMILKGKLISFLFMQQYQERLDRLDF